MRRILAVRQDNNGDVTLLGPALRALGRGANEIILVCGPSGEGAARLLPAVNDVRVVRAEWIEARARPVEPAAIAADVAAFASLAVDEAFIFTSFHQSPLPTALVLRLAGVPNIAATSVDYPGTLLDWRVPVDDDLHEVERALALVGARGYALDPRDDGRLAYLPLGPRLPELPARFIVVQPGASVPARAWQPAKLEMLVSRLVARGDEVVVVGNSSETELGNAVVGTSGARNLCGRTTYAEFASVVRDADALVVGNTSGIHVAAAVGTPVVSIFPPTIPPRRFAPWHVPHTLLGNHAIACAGCRARECPLAGQPCTGVLTVDAVLAALDSLLVAAGSRRILPTEEVA